MGVPLYQASDFGFEDADLGEVGVFLVDVTSDEVGKFLLSLL
jgi:hypothetical protein